MIVSSRNNIAQRFDCNNWLDTTVNNIKLSGHLVLLQNGTSKDFLFAPADFIGLQRPTVPLITRFQTLVPFCLACNWASAT